MSKGPETIIKAEESSETLETFKTFDTFETIATVDPENSETLETFRTLDTFETIDTSAVAQEAAETEIPEPASVPTPVSNQNPGQAAEGELVLVNIMEEVIRMEAPKIMNSFGMCVCEICLYDVMAFALNNVPAKYVVSRRGALFAKISSYRNQYRTDTIASLTQACSIVMRSPRHP